MFEVKVKTLDGRTHEFPEVPDNVTVIEFKGIISEKMEIAVDRQRLLYQGRVLQDDVLLSTYEVAGNVMHLVTRYPPQAPAAAEVIIEDEDNSDLNRDHIRHMLSDVFNNIGGDLSNQMGGSVSVNNEGNRMDITVNIPTQNRLSLSRLRQNYVMRLLDQARGVIGYAVDPTLTTAPRDDRDRMRQADPYDIGPNDERITEVTAQPLPIGNLADMIGMTRELWRSAEPQLEQWESVLRRENGTDSAPRTDAESQRIHDSTSRYMHLFSHILHILSDYLVEFQPSHGANAAARRATAARTAHATADADIPQNSEPETPSTPTVEANDRSRYLYVFSEMPAQLVQVRLDVDTDIRDLRPTAMAQTPVTAQPPRPTESPRPMNPPTEATATAVPASTDTTDPRTTRPRRRFQASTNTMENLFRSTLHDTIMGQNLRPQTATGARPLRSSAPQFTDNVDPYVRCQSRHFQHPSNLRAGAVISTFSGIRLRNGRTVDPTPTSTANNTTTPHTNVRSQSTDHSDPMRSILDGLMSSIFSGSGQGVGTATRTTATTTGVLSTEPVAGQHDMARILQSFTRTAGSNLNTSLLQIFPEMLGNIRQMIPDNFVTSEMVQLVLSSLTLTDFLGIVRGQYTCLNQLRLPLQELLMNHQRQVGSRDILVDHVVADMAYFSRGYIAVFDRLRSGGSVENLSDEARSSFNLRLDIFRTMDNLNKHHCNSMIDMILRSPTNQGFGQLLMNSLVSHHDQSLALIDVICNNNDELRQFLIKSFLDSMASSMGDISAPSQISLGLDLINSGLFRRPTQLTELCEHTLANFAVYLTENGDSVVPMDMDDVDDSIDHMVTNLSENITNGAVVVTEMERGSLMEPGVLPAEWLEVMSRDSSSMIEADDEQLTTAVPPYSDAYVAGMPPKRRKVIVSQRQRAVQAAPDMMHDCIEEAISSAGLIDHTRAAAVLLPPGLFDAFQELASERVANRLTEEARNFVPDRFPAAEHNFNRKKRPEEDKKNN